MGSFQQISIGIICLVAAFMFGSYVNSYPDPDHVTHAFSDLVDQDGEGAVTSLLDSGIAEQRAAPMETMRNQLASRLPMLKSVPDSRLSLELPPPSQLDGPDNAGKLAAPAKMPNLLDASNRREVVVPDFSRLAAQFKNTPLELPPMQPLVSRGERGGTVRTPTTDNGMVEAPAAGPPKGSEFDIPTKSAQPVPTPAQRDGLAGSLKDRLKSLPEQDSSIDAGMQSLIRPAEALDLTTTAAPESVQEPKPAEDQPESSSAEYIINGVRSYQEGDPFTTSPFVTNEPPPGTDELAQVNRSESGDTVPNSPTVSSQPQPHSSSKPKIPFGLTEQAKTELVRLKRPQDSSITLGTTKFKTHKTLRGDSLQKISTRYYGRPDFYLDIYLANQQQLRNPAEVPRGILLKIPVYE